jgi:ketosteroid isomerase-like protein
MKKFSVLSICIALAFCVSFATFAIASDEEDVLQVATNFAKALNTSDFDLMASIWWHSPKASSFEPGTVPFLIQGWDGIKEWWSGNLTGPVEDSGTLSFYNPQVTMLGKDFAFATIYHVSESIDPTTNVSTTDIVRQSLFIQRINGKWLIVHAHNSSYPTG